MTKITPDGDVSVAETTSSNDGLLTVSEVARQLRVDDTTVRRWVKQGALEAVELPHLGKRRGYRIRAKTLNNLLENSTVSGD